MFNVDLMQYAKKVTEDYHVYVNRDTLEIRYLVVVPNVF